MNEAIQIAALILGILVVVAGVIIAVALSGLAKAVRDHGTDSPA